MGIFTFWRDLRASCHAAETKHYAAEYEDRLRLLEDMHSARMTDFGVAAGDQSRKR